MLRTASINQVNQSDANIYLVGNPQVTFFKSVFKRHTNFAIESTNIPFRGNRRLIKEKNITLKCKIPQYGDLLGKIYLKFNIPPMKTSKENKFEFNKHFGYSIIKNIKLKINGVIVDNIDGEMLYILNKLQNNDEKQKMVSKLINPTQTNNYFYKSSSTNTGVNNKIHIHKYHNAPIYTEQNTIYIPLTFSFTNFSKTYIPFFLLENKSIEIEVEIRGSDHMYTIEKFDKDYWYYEKIPHISTSGYPISDISGHTARLQALENTSISGLNSPLTYGEQTTYKETSTTAFYLKRFESRKRSVPTEGKDDINQFTYNSDRFDLQPSLEIEQIFLTEEERQKFKDDTNHYLIEQIHKKERINIKGNQLTTLNIDNHTNLIKELCITVTRNDNKNRNQWLNFTNYDSADMTEEDIIKYQDNWWYTSVKASESSLTLAGSTTNITIIPDRFQEFLFRYGPYGEAFNDKKAGNTGWPSKVDGQYSPYSIENINEFRNIWKYRSASEIPDITKDNFSNMWKISPLKDMQILYDGVQREDTKDSIYFNQIQTHKHHTNEIDPSVYLYSFSLEPEKYQPSGYCNMNLFKRIQYKLNLRQNEEKTLADWLLFSNTFWNNNKSNNIKTVTINGSIKYYWSTRPGTKYDTGGDTLRVESDEEASALFDNRKYKYNIIIYSLKYNFIEIKKNKIIPEFNLAL
jgi:hypothetical protein